MKDNPYVGPRPYERADRHNFFGRNREARDLQSLILAERVVLFYAQSGAGKTSLLNAAVIPALEEEGFAVLPLARVGSEIPSWIGPGMVRNVFVFSALMGLAQGDMPPETLLSRTVSSFLVTHCRAEKADPFLGTRSTLVVFDQFEELFTAHRERWQERREFFEQVAEALDKYPQLGVVFAMREDYVAELDAYAALFPRRLKARFRMERLGAEGALEAVEKPAANEGYPFAPEVAEWLVDDLRRIKVQKQSEQEEAEVLGPYVEPVQLQVVCSRLWEGLSEGKGVIQWDDVQKYGDVDQALSNFYESALAETVQETQVGERALRRWFSQQMITPMGTKGLAVRGEVETAGLPNAAVDVLEKQRLIRAEARAGARWYELSHDRLVDPVLASNEAWEAAQETPLRMAARRWQEVGDDSLLYRDQALQEALEWSQAHPGQVASYETAFLAASQQAQELRAARGRRLRRAVSIALLVGGLVMAVLTIAALRGQMAAEEQRDVALTAYADADLQRSLALTAQADADVQRNLAMEQREAALAAQATAVAAYEALVAQRQLELDRSFAQYLATIAEDFYDTAAQSWLVGEFLAIESLNRYPSVKANGVLQNMLDFTGPIVVQVEHPEEVTDLVFVSERDWLVTAGESGLQIWDVSSGESVAEEAGQLLSASDDGRWLAIADGPGRIRVWDVTTGQETTVATDYTQLAFSADFQQLATVDSSGLVQVWETATADPLALLRGHSGAVVDLSFSASGQQLVTAGSDGTVRIWDVGTSQQVTQLTGEASRLPVTEVIFSPDGQYVATASEGGGGVAVWDWREDQQLAEWGTGRPFGLVMSSNGGQVAWYANDDYRDPSFDAYAWNWQDDPQPFMLWGAIGELVPQFAGSSDSSWLLFAGDSMTRIWLDDGQWEEIARLEGEVAAMDAEGNLLAVAAGRSVTVWEWDSGKLHQVSEHPLAGMTGEFYLHEGGQWVAGIEGQTVRVWDLASGRETLSLEQHEPVADVVFDPDGQWVAVLGEAGTVRIWELSSGEEMHAVGSQGLVAGVVFSPGGQWVAVVGEDGTIEVWEVASAQLQMLLPVGQQGTQQATQEGETGATAAVIVFSPDDRWVAAAAGDGTVGVWEVVSGEEIALSGYLSDIGAMAFSPDSQQLLIASYDLVEQSMPTAIGLWDLATGENLRQYGYIEFIDDVAFSPDGQRIVMLAGGEVVLVDTEFWQEVARVHQTELAGVAIAGFAGQSEWMMTYDTPPVGDPRGLSGCPLIRMWNVTSGGELLQLPFPGSAIPAAGGVTAAAFVPDTPWLVTYSDYPASQYEGLYFWLWRAEEIIQAVCARLQRGLTLEEQYLFIGDEVEICPGLSSAGE
ncbi:MAG: hypothetical protein JW900_01565 [Anaerolineae bacterium]|nr:hypothetical protein [Anaerolineae bacterium]